MTELTTRLHHLTSSLRSYCKLLNEKRSTVGDQADKLKNGLQKLSDTAIQARHLPRWGRAPPSQLGNATSSGHTTFLIWQVSEMSVELEQKKKVVAKAQVILSILTSPDQCHVSAM